MTAIWLSFQVFSSENALEPTLKQSLRATLPRLFCNLSTGAPGSIIASPENANPNYDFHWIRDSALVAISLVNLHAHVPGAEEKRELETFLADYVRFSRQLQLAPTPHGLGEVRFLPDGRIDTEKWSRPQYDGPALRALSMLKLIQTVPLPAEVSTLAHEVLEADIEGVIRFHRLQSFDLWEYSKGYHLYTRMVQLGMLEKTYFWNGRSSSTEQIQAMVRLRQDLEDHWDPDRKFLMFSETEGTDVDGHPVLQPGEGLDASIALALIHANRDDRYFSLHDDRAWHTLWLLEDFFRREFPINQGDRHGPAIGRHKGDGYFGGNAFFFLTSAYAELYFKIARILKEERLSLRVSELNRSMLEHTLGKSLSLDQVIELPDREVTRAFAAKGDAFLQTMMDVLPENGMMAEQFDKNNGSPASARDLTWSYASFLSAVLERQSLFADTPDLLEGISLRCPSGSRLKQAYHDGRQDQTKRNSIVERGLLL